MIHLIYLSRNQRDFGEKGHINCIVLHTIYYQNKSLNRTAQRISLIGLLGIVGRIAKDCAEREDETGKKVVKILFALILVSQILLGIDAISDVIERRK